MAGPEKKGRLLSDKERTITAYHEMGHALVGHFLTHTDPVHKISIVSRGAALGYTISLPAEDKFLTTMAELNDSLAMTLGGRAAEEIQFGEITTGAANDLEKATDTAKQMIMRWGMSAKLGARTLGHNQAMPFLGRDFSQEPDYSEEVARAIDDEIRRIIEEAHDRARAVLAAHREALDVDRPDLGRARDHRARRVRGPAGRHAAGRGLPRQGRARPPAQPGRGRRGRGREALAGSAQAEGRTSAAGRLTLVI